MFDGWGAGESGQGVDTGGQFVGAGCVEEDAFDVVGGAEILEEEGVGDGTFCDHDAVCVIFA